RLEMTGTRDDVPAHRRNPAVLQLHGQGITIFARKLAIDGQHNPVVPDYERLVAGKVTIVEVAASQPAAFRPRGAIVSGNLVVHHGAAVPADLHRFVKEPENSLLVPVQHRISHELVGEPATLGPFAWRY